MATFSYERYPHERQELIVRSLRDEPNYWYGKFDILRELTQSALGLEQHPPVKLNTELFEAVTPANIITYWKNVGGRLIIEGDAGIGKTTLLLEIADILAREAALDDTLPIPAIVHLGTWHVGRKNLQDFIHPLLPVHDSAVNWWLRRGNLMLMLEGIAEIPLAHRGEALGKIRKLVSQFPKTAVLVTSQPDEIGPFLPEFEHRIELLPLSDEQVHDYLDELGPPLIGLREALPIDADLAILARRPLLLTMMVLTFAYQTSVQILEYGVKSRDDLMRAYVEWCMDNAEVENSPYPREKIWHWLSWLGYQFQREGQFLVDLNVDMTHRWVSDPALFPKLFPLRKRLFVPAVYSLMGWLGIIFFPEPFTGLVLGFLFGIPMLMAAWLRDDYQLKVLYAEVDVNEQHPSAVRLYFGYLALTIIIGSLVMFVLGAFRGEYDIVQAFYKALFCGAFYIFFGISALGRIDQYMVIDGREVVAHVLFEEGSIPEDLEAFQKYAEQELYVLQNWGRMTGFVHSAFCDYFAEMYSSPHNSEQTS